MNNIDIAELVPHSGKMSLLHKVLEYDEKSLRAQVVVRQDGLFDQGQEVSAWLGIEYMAQTIAAFTGVEDRLAGRPVRSGFLLGTRRYESDRPYFRVGEVLTVKVIKLMQDQALAVFACTLSGESMQASAKLNVYQPPATTQEQL